MRAVVVDHDRSLVVRHLAPREPGPQQVRIRVAACGICGSDLHLRRSATRFPAGGILGHEFAGVIEALGSQVTGWQVNDRVCVHPGRPSHAHDPWAIMANAPGLGARPGAYAETVVCEVEMLWRLPTEMPIEHGALVEPLAVALHAINVAAVEPDHACAVLGAGPIGAICVAALRARGVARLALIEPNERRRDAARQLGVPVLAPEQAREAIHDQLGGPPHRVFECAGHPSALPLSLALVAPCGVVTVLGMLDEPASISQATLMLKEAQIRSSIFYRVGDFDEAVKLIARRTIPVEHLITEQAPLEQTARLFEELASGTTPQLKVLLRP
jgi:(R,R)-butanediol dehydrogenase/meso-butanediol dehydrogenase/diacetyl reductase